MVRGIWNMSHFFRFERNGGLCDLVRDGKYWYRSTIYPARILDALENDPIPFPEQRGAAWFDIRALKKTMIASGWKQIEKARNCTKYETGNRTTKKKVKK